MEIERLDVEKEAVCCRILDELPAWFGIEESKVAYARAARDLPMFVGRLDRQMVGFVTLKLHNAFAAEIHALGVLPHWHRRGLGTLLVAEAERFAVGKGMRFLTVKTLVARRPDANYAATRAFYHAVGFVPLEELPELWGPENPCLIMIKSISV